MANLNVTLGSLSELLLRHEANAGYSASGLPAMSYIQSIICSCRVGVPWDLEVLTRWLIHVCRELPAGYISAGYQPYSTAWDLQFSGGQCNIEELIYDNMSFQCRGIQHDFRNQ